MPQSSARRGPGIALSIVISIVCAGLAVTVILLFMHDENVDARIGYAVVLAGAAAGVMLGRLGLYRRSKQTVSAGSGTAEPPSSTPYVAVVGSVSLLAALVLPDEAIVVFCAAAEALFVAVIVVKLAEGLRLRRATSSA
ncbi:hypothetical protein GCM10027448_27790 [Nocardioides dilutus]